jgi:hypothetical protein
MVKSPTAVQSVTEGHDTAFSGNAPLGTGWSAQVPEPPDRATIPLPTAVQDELVVHETPARLPMPAGRVWLVHVEPPSMVETMEPAPAAVQSLDDGHETLSSPDTPMGTDCEDQLVPPSEVANIWDPSAYQHWVAEAQDSPPPDVIGPDTPVQELPPFREVKVPPAPATMQNKVWTHDTPVRPAPLSEETPSHTPGPADT